MIPMALLNGVIQQAYVNLTFQPANDTFYLEYPNSYSGLGDPEIMGDRYEGKSYPERLCVRFGAQTHLDAEVWFENDDGTLSNHLTIQIPKPAGANRGQEDASPAIATR